MPVIALFRSYDRPKSELGDNKMAEGQSAVSVGNAIDGHVQQVVKQAHDELLDLLSRRAELVKRIGTVKQTIAGLAGIFGESVLSEDLSKLVGDAKSTSGRPGFTRTCRLILMQAKRPMSAREVCETIRTKEPEMLSQHKDPISSVTTVMNRLAKYGEAEAVTLGDGRRAWHWMAERG